MYAFIQNTKFNLNKFLKIIQLTSKLATNNTAYEELLYISKFNSHSIIKIRTQVNVVLCICGQSIVVYSPVMFVIDDLRIKTMYILKFVKRGNYL